MRSTGNRVWDGACPLVIGHNKVAWIREFHLSHCDFLVGSGGISFSPTMYVSPYLRVLSCAVDITYFIHIFFTVSHSITADPPSQTKPKYSR